MDTGRGASHTVVSYGGTRGSTAKGWGGWGGLTRGEIPDRGDGWIKAANHLSMYVPMQQSCMICTCMFIAAQFTIEKYGTSPNAHGSRDKEIVIYVCI